MVELLVVVALVVILAAILLPVASKMIERGQVSKSISNVREFAMVHLMYANEHGGQLPAQWDTQIPPDDRDDWHRSQQFRPYLDGQDLWEHPVTRDPLMENPDRSHGHVSGWMMTNASLQGNDQTRSSPPRKMASIPEPSKTILLAPRRWHTKLSWENEETFKKGFRRYQDSKSTFAFMDGHAELLSFEETYDPGASVNLWWPDDANE